MTSKREIRYAMTKSEKISLRKNLHRLRQQRWRENRKNALNLINSENLHLDTGHHLGKVVRAVLDEKNKARNRAMKQYKKILNNPRLLAEKKHTWGV